MQQFLLPGIFDAVITGEEKYSCVDHTEKTKIDQVLSFRGPDKDTLTRCQATSVAKHAKAPNIIVLNLSKSQLSKQGRLIEPLITEITGSILTGLLCIKNGLQLP
ncbi:hypothetical protein ACJMK2_031610 [Sinanodonta woodiana]|uniref:Uncharacterized protein n=1 Tax=Sinanodonta woodiana TaxID=1069815 RepID=A0ABD3WYW7_SINWO